MVDCLLFVDLLGTKAALRSGGLSVVQSRITAFQDRFVSLLAARGPLDLGADSDSGVAIFSNAVEAVEAGDVLFRGFFDEDDSDSPFWIRGVIVAAGGASTLTELKIARTNGGAQMTSPADPLLAALMAEKSGFKGMRLRVDEKLLTGADRYDLQKTIIQEEPYDNVAPPTMQVYRTKALRNATGGQVLGDRFEDVLWPLDDEPAFNARDADLSYRLRRAGRDSEEAQHAVFTKVVFEEVRAIAGIVRR